MIGNSACWRFIEPIADSGFYEDEIVEHLGTLHRARRRAFNLKLSKDENALAEICRQAALIGNLQHPSLPRYYGGEVVEGQYTIVSELIEGRPFIDTGSRDGWQGIFDWCDHVTRLVEELTPLEALRVDYSRLRTNQIVVTQRGRLRFTTTWPVGSVSKDRLASPFLSRMIASPNGGLFIGDAAPDPVASLDNLQVILYHLAIGKDSKSLEGAIAEEAREVQQIGTRELASCIGLEKSLGDLILSMKRPNGTREIMSLQALGTAARKLKKKTQQRLEEERSGKKGEPGSSANYGKVADRASSSRSPIISPAPASTMDSSGPFFPTASPMAAAREMSTARESGAAPVVRNRAQAVDAPQEKITYAKVDKGMEEDAAEDLYPKRPDVVTSASGEKIRVQDLPKAHNPRAGMFIKAGIGAIVLVAICAGAFHVLKKATAPVNKAPTAVISKAPTYVSGIDKVFFEGVGSSDPEGSSLSYHWKVVQPADADSRFEPNNSTLAVKSEAQFFRGGHMVVELRVFDGSLFSEPVTKEVDVTSSR